MKLVKNILVVIGILVLGSIVLAKEINIATDNLRETTDKILTLGVGDVLKIGTIIADKITLDEDSRTNWPDVASWSGNSATQMITWLGYEIVTNEVPGGINTNELVVTGEGLNPVVNGTYTITNAIYVTDEQDTNYPAYYSTNGYPICKVVPGQGNWYMIPQGDMAADPYFHNVVGGCPTGVWSATPEVGVGNPIVNYGVGVVTNVTTNIVTWAVGINSTSTPVYFSIAKDGEEWFRVYSNSAEFTNLLIIQSLELNGETRTNWPSTNELAATNWVDSFYVKKTGETNILDLSGANYITIPASTYSSSPTTRKELNDAIEGSKELKLYGATNRHPVLTWTASLWDTPPSVWIVTNAMSPSTTNIIGTFWRTNSTDRIRDDSYVGKMYVKRISGNSTAYGYIRLIYSSDNGATTNYFGDTSGPSENFSSDLTSYLIEAVNKTAITGTTLWFGVEYFIIVGAGSGATIATYGGTAYNTQVAFGGIGTPAGMATLGDLANWSQYPAVSGVNLGTNPMTLGGESRTNWPVGSGESGSQILSATGTNMITYSAVYNSTPKLFIQTYTGATYQITYQVTSHTASGAVFVARNSGGLETNTGVAIEWATANAFFNTNNQAWCERVPIGSIQMYGSLIPPSGWLNCDGSAISRTTYTNLFNAIGTNFGIGNGSTTFNLPDFRGVFAKGAGTTSRTAGTNALNEYYSATLGVYYLDHFQGHAHNIAMDYSDGNTTGILRSGAIANYNSFAASQPSTLSASGKERWGASTEPQSLGVNYIIKYADVLATTLQTVVPLDGSVPMTGELQVPSLKLTGAISGSSVTNPGQWFATNINGWGCWQASPYLHAYPTQIITYVDATIATMKFHGVSGQIGGSWDGVKYSPGVIGNLNFYVGQTFHMGGVADPASFIRVYVNENNDIKRNAINFITADSDPAITMATSIRCSNPTNFYTISIFPHVGRPSSNYVDAKYFLDIVVTP